ncbi:peptidoglycan-binding protein [Bradyrhizobium sp. BR 1432]|uniref:peptidoglycan-binding domain-containing protein n=1 Tax=Bradyrhizobium sp. BR 1432 TaxID=3447966 RepID=UPI003EE5D8BD
MNTRKNRFLLTTAVLLAGVSLASAQGMREGAGGGMSGGAAAGAESGRSGGGMSHGAGGASHGEGMTQGRAGGRAEGPAAAPSRSERSEGMPASGKADRGERKAVDQGRGARDNARQSQSEGEKRGKDQTVGQSRGGPDQARQSRSERDKSGMKDQTTGQSRSDRDATRQSQGAEQGRSATTGANTKDNVQGKKAQGQSTTTTGANTKDNAQGKNVQGQSTTTTGAKGNAQGQSAPTTGANTNNAQAPSAQQGTTTGANTQGQVNTQAQAQGGTTQSLSGRVQVSAQQQTTLQQSVLSSRNVDRVRVNFNSINFRINTGVVVPRNISVVAISTFPVLIDIYPAYRDDSFFVVDDEIIVVDRSHRIVDAIPAGPRTHFARRGSVSGGGGNIAALDLSPDDIRIVQRVLIERGLMSGQADGILGPATREALITFQRREGFQTTGSIDTRTVAALGVSNQIRATQGQSTTTGQGRLASRRSRTRPGKAPIRPTRRRSRTRPMRRHSRTRPPDRLGRTNHPQPDRPSRTNRRRRARQAHNRLLVRPPDRRRPKATVSLPTSPATRRLGKPTKIMPRRLRRRVSRLRINPTGKMPPKPRLWRGSLRPARRPGAMRSIERGIHFAAGIRGEMDSGLASARRPGMTELVVMPSPRPETPSPARSVPRNPAGSRRA